MDLIEVIIKKDGSFAIKGLDMVGNPKIHQLEQLLAKDLGVVLKDIKIRGVKEKAIVRLNN